MSSSLPARERASPADSGGEKIRKTNGCLKQFRNSRRTLPGNAASLNAAGRRGDDAGRRRRLTATGVASSKKRAIERRLGRRAVTAILDCHRKYLETGGAFAAVTENIWRRAGLLLLSQKIFGDGRGFCCCKAFALLHEWAVALHRRCVSRARQR